MLVVAKQIEKFIQRLRKIRIKHHLQFPSIVEHPVLGDHCVGVERLGVHLVVVVLSGQIEQDGEGKVQVVGLTQVRLFSQSNQTSLLGRGLL